MNKIIKDVLIKIENEGFEAYIVGGYVRDILVGKSSFDIDICTNATPKELINIFPDASTKNLGGISFKKNEYFFEITTYRKEILYDKRRPIKFLYVNNLVEDITRRDFTINAICMNKKGEILDILEGIKDLEDMKVRVIGDARIKFKDDPLRILRALRFATVLNFNLDEELKSALIETRCEILKLSKSRVKEEFDKILLSPFVKRGLQLMNELGVLELIDVKYQDIVPVKNLEGMYAQLDTIFPFPFTKIEKESITKIREILKLEEINELVIYKYGLYLCLIAGEILHIDKKVISKKAKELVINDKKDIDLTSEDIVSNLNIPYSKVISVIMEELERLIIEKKLKNEKKILINYIIMNKDRWV